jgi:MOSC domain-containing protein YiiM
VAGRVVQVNVSKGGVPKLPLPEASVGENGLDGDGHNEPLTVHGGPERAVCLFAVERIAALAAEGHPIAPGTTGENITTEGVEWDAVTPGARFRIGESVLLEVTRYTTPCATIRASFRDRDSNRIHQNVHPGWSRVYARVIDPGVVRPGDAVELIH